MKNKAPFLHLLVVPVLTILVCNGLTVNLLDVLSGGVFLYITPLKYLMVFLTGLYGFYLHILRQRSSRNYLIIVASVIAGLFWIHFRPTFLIWLLGAGINFSVMRILIMQKDYKAGLVDMAYAFGGMAVAIFLYPLSFTLAVAGFLTVQILCEMRTDVHASLFKKNRFDESLKTAKKVLGDYGS